MTAAGPGALARFIKMARAVVGDAHVLTDPAQTEGYAVDWTRRWVGATPAVVRPAGTDEVTELVRAARDEGVALVPQGGNTGLVGGGVPLAGEVVLSLRRLDGIEPVDVLAGQVTVGAGVVLSSLQAEARAAGLAFGVDLAARDSATIGGMVATNAGGLHVVRHGPMRAQLVGVEAVLGTGDVVSRLAGLTKDNTGYELAQLLCGSEGTLGIVTRARLRLVPAPGQEVTALLGLPSVAGAVRLAARLRSGLPGVQALEVMTGPGMRLVADHLGTLLPVAPEAGAFLLVEVGSDDDPTDALAAALDSAAAAGEPDVEVLDAAVATSGPDRARLWRFREGHAEAAAARGLVHKLDVTLPTARFADFCAEVEERITGRWPGAVTLLFGHVGDGNIHVNTVLPEAAGAADREGEARGAGAADREGEARGAGAADREGEELADLVLGLVVARAGSISAEHGIGAAKRRWLVRNRSEAEVAAMRAIKHALDPDGVLNPHVLFP